MLLNVFIFGTALFFLGVTPALYSILTYVAASKTVDFLVYGIEQYTGVTIVSEQSEEIRRAITEDLRRGVTLYRGMRGFGKRGHQNMERDIVFAVVTRLELPELRKVIERIDPKAFVVQHSVDDAAGGMLKRRPLH